jgi:hypothetical protein
MLTRKSNKSQQQGAILAEFAIISGFVLIPLTLLMPVMFKFIEAKQYIEQASRYAVWERVAYYQKKPKNRDSFAPVKTDEQLKHEIQNRFLSAAKTPLYLSQATDKVAEELNPNLMVNDLTSNKRISMFAKPKNSPDTYVGSATAQHSLPNSASFTGVVSKVLTLAPGFELNQKGLYQTTISTGIRMYDWFPELGDKVINMKRTNALLAEGWSMGGPENAKKELKYLVPITSAMDAMGVEKLFKVLKIIPIAKELGWMDLGKIEPDAVPCVRLGSFNKKGRVSTPKNCETRLKQKLKKLGHKY